MPAPCPRRRRRGRPANAPTQIALDDIGEPTEVRLSASTISGVAPFCGPNIAGRSGFADSSLSTSHATGSRRPRAVDPPLRRRCDRARASPPPPRGIGAPTASSKRTPSASARPAARRRSRCRLAPDDALAPSRERRLDELSCPVARGDHRIALAIGEKRETRRARHFDHRCVPPSPRGPTRLASVGRADRSHGRTPVVLRAPRTSTAPSVTAVGDRNRSSFDSRSCTRQSFGDRRGHLERIEAPFSELGAIRTFTRRRRLRALGRAGQLGLASRSGAQKRVASASSSTWSASVSVSSSAMRFSLLVFSSSTFARAWRAPREARGSGTRNRRPRDYADLGLLG